MTAQHIVIVRMDLDTMGAIACDSKETAIALRDRLASGLMSDFSVEYIPLEAKTAAMDNLDEIVDFFTSDPE